MISAQALRSLSIVPERCTTACRVVVSDSDLNERSIRRLVRCVFDPRRIESFELMIVIMVPAWSLLTCYIHGLRLAELTGVETGLVIEL